MKKYLLAAALVVASASAVADRMITETNGTYLGADSSKTTACASAKERASEGLNNRNEEVKWFSECSCSQGKSDGRGEHWMCSVDARVGKRS